MYMLSNIYKSINKYANKIKREYICDLEIFLFLKIYSQYNQHYN